MWVIKRLSQNKKYWSFVDGKISSLQADFSKGFTFLGLFHCHNHYGQNQLTYFVHEVPSDLVELIVYFKPGGKYLSKP